jgi:hypothetical protein
MPEGAGHVYLVTADHGEEKYRAEERPVVVWREDGGFSASAFPYGRYVGAPTPERAILQLLERSGCTNVRIDFSPKLSWCSS